MATVGHKLRLDEDRAFDIAFEYAKPVQNGKIWYDLACIEWNRRAEDGRYIWLVYFRARIENGVVDDADFHVVIRDDTGVVEYMQGLYRVDNPDFKDEP